MKRRVEFDLSPSKLQGILAKEHVSCLLNSVRQQHQSHRTVTLSSIRARQAAHSIGRSWDRPIMRSVSYGTRAGDGLGFSFFA